MTDLSDDTPEDGDKPTAPAAPSGPGPVAPEETGSPTLPPAKARRAWSRVRAYLSAEDLANPGVQKLLVDEVETLHEQKELLEGFREDLHQEQLKNSELSGRLKSNVREEIMSSIGLTIGSAMLGFAPTVWKDQSLLAGMLTAFAVVLLAGSITAKAMK